jgi:hypothetical protein
MSNKAEMVSDLRNISSFSFDIGNELDFRCCSCYTYLNKVCDRCSRCGASPYRPCVHCDLDLR